MSPNRRGSPRKHPRKQQRPAKGTDASDTSDREEGDIPLSYRARLSDLLSSLGKRYRFPTFMRRGSRKSTSPPNDTNHTENDTESRDETNNAQDKQQFNPFNLDPNIKISDFDNASVPFFWAFFAMFRWASLSEDDRKTDEQRDTFLKNEDSYKPLEETDDLLGFLAFVGFLRFDMRISYTIYTYAVHLYLLYWSFCRIRYHSLLVDEESYWRGWAVTFLPFLDKARPFTFVDYASLFQFYFYLGSFILHHLSTGLERWFYMYMLPFINGVVWGSFWAALRDSNEFDIGYYWINPNKDRKPLSRWVTHYSPLLYWAFFLFTRRAYISTVLYDYQSSFRTYEPCDKDMNPIERRKKTEDEEQLEDVLAWSRMTFTQFCTFAPFLPLIIWRILAFFNPEFSQTALISSLGIFMIIFVGFTASIMLGAWYDFMTFSRTYVLWLEDFKTGITFDFYSKTMQAGIIY